jgi:hypothetical protein
MWRHADADLIRMTAHEQQRPALLPVASETPGGGTR